mmetsp:Transcript_48557/g.110630  ORF Transcript_48557/g.110630 Transcript_48557/m.110630 type:complete len:262 (+) Transcript_48557:588-1373(+)
MPGPAFLTHSVIPLAVSPNISGSWLFSRMLKVCCKPVRRSCWAKSGATPCSFAPARAALIINAQVWKATPRTSSQSIETSSVAERIGNKASAVGCTQGMKAPSSSVTKVCKSCTDCIISSNFWVRTLTSLPSPVDTCTYWSSSSSSAPAPFGFAVAAFTSSRLRLLKMPTSKLGRNGAKSFFKHWQIRSEASLMYSRCTSSASKDVFIISVKASFASGRNFSLPTAMPSNDMHSKALPRKRFSFSPVACITNCLSMGMMTS